jgi:SAM-dependent methyltransferase
MPGRKLTYYRQLAVRRPEVTECTVPRHVPADVGAPIAKPGRDTMWRDKGAVVRSAEELRQHYEIEKELGDRLRNSRREERAVLYSQVYDELFRRVPKHPQLTDQNTAAHERKVQGHLRLLRPYLTPETVFMEVGAGDCALPRLAAQLVRKAYGLEVSEELTRKLPSTDKFQALLTKSCNIPLPDNAVDLVFSFQMIEHIHPDDVIEQLKDIYRVLTPGGYYYCITPNRLYGPNDASRDFDREATGLHLKEYSITDLLTLFRSVGFRRVWIERIIKGHRFPFPALPVRMLEGILGRVPWSIRTPFTRSFLGTRLLNVSVMGRK